MRKLSHILSLILTVTFLFPSFAMGETVKLKDLVSRDGLYFKKFTDTPFTGDVKDTWRQGKIIDGKKEGRWIEYHGNGQLEVKGNYKDGLKEGSWVRYHETGALWRQGIYRQGKREGRWFEFNKWGEEKLKSNTDPEFWTSGVYKNNKWISD